ncbi:MAG: hypothetical protein F6K11_05665 [Leptolyngbya sp. SIO3F4]|nr:hypothetical protein [Leptolyngbya sp. SIO3F4]
MQANILGVGVVGAAIAWFLQSEAIFDRAMKLLPEAANLKLSFWTGLPPSTQSNQPCIGKTRYTNLSGHSTLDWMHFCSSGKAIADIISGKQIDVVFRCVQSLQGLK